MGNKVNGIAGPGQKITSRLDYITVASTVDFRPGVFGSASQTVLDKLVEIISINGQPVIMNTPYLDAANSNRCTVKVAIEHTGSWDATALLAAIVAHQAAGMGFTALNTTVTFGTF